MQALSTLCKESSRVTIVTHVYKTPNSPWCRKTLSSKSGNDLHSLTLQAGLFFSSLVRTVMLLSELPYWQRCLPAHNQIFNILLVRYPGLFTARAAAHLEGCPAPCHLSHTRCHGARLLLRMSTCLMVQKPRSPFHSLS